MSEEFSQLEATLTEAARQGNIAHVIALLRDTGRLHHLWQPNQAQALAITKAAAVCLRRGGARPLAKRDKEVVQDLQGGGQSGEVGSDSDKGDLAGDERLLKGYMVSSVNEWGADQTRILLLTDEALHRVKYDPHKEHVVSARSAKLEDILRMEYGSFSPAASSITTFLFRREIEDQQGFRVFTKVRDAYAVTGDETAGELERRAAHAHGMHPGLAKEQVAEHRPEEHFREYRALLAEHEPWKEEVFMLELVAALQAVKILSKSTFEIRLAKMVKAIPGGIVTLLHNANRRRQHGLA
ncbi:hypothetical protein T484DRAFT_1929332 [Baffinella frigidus]|nr:hypothetical protein T484DRAFT_1929332 [Cryptophyta sp. CCMP2293]